MKENNIKLINAKCTNCGAVIEINEATKESGALVCPRATLLLLPKRH